MEVCHPDVTRKYAQQLLLIADYFVCLLTLHVYMGRVGHQGEGVPVVSKRGCVIHFFKRFEKKVFLKQKSLFLSDFFDFLMKNANF